MSDLTTQAPTDADLSDREINSIRDVEGVYYETGGQSPTDAATEPRIECPECEGSGSLSLDQARRLRGDVPTFMVDQEHLDRAIKAVTGETIYPDAATAECTDVSGLIEELDDLQQSDYTERRALALGVLRIIESRQGTGVASSDEEVGYVGSYNNPNGLKVGDRIQYAPKEGHPRTGVVRRIPSIGWMGKEKFYIAWDDGKRTTRNAEVSHKFLTKITPPDDPGASERGG